MVTKIYVIRHCQTEGNLKNILQGRQDTDPSQLGQFQLGLLAGYMKDKGLDKIYSSHLGRAKKTAEAINMFYGHDVIVDERIAEVNLGDFEGMVMTDLVESHPEFAIGWKNAPHLLKAPNGETMEDVYNRMSKAFLDLVEQNKGKTIAIISHGCAIQNLICYCYGKDISELPSIALGINTGVNEIEVDENGKMTVLRHNSADHLPESMKKRVGRFLV